MVGQQSLDLLIGVRVPVPQPRIHRSARDVAPVDLEDHFFRGVPHGFGLLFFVGHAVATDVPLPPVNLGDTSFQDGVAFPGWLVWGLFEFLI
jgi:hypothetical protein